MGILRRLLAGEDMPPAIDSTLERRALLEIADDRARQHAISHGKDDRPRPSYDENTQLSHETAAVERHSVQPEATAKEQAAEHTKEEHGPRSAEKEIPGKQSTGEAINTKSGCRKRRRDEAQEDDSALLDNQEECGCSSGGEGDLGDNRVSNDEQVLLLLDPERTTRRISSLESQLLSHVQCVEHLRGALQVAQGAIFTAKAKAQALRDGQMKAHEADRQHLQDLFITRPIQALQEQQQQDREDLEGQSGLLSPCGADCLLQLRERTVARLEDCARAILAQHDDEARALLSSGMVGASEDGEGSSSIARHEAKLQQLHDKLRQEQVREAAKQTELRLLRNMVQARVVRGVMAHMDDATVKRVRHS